MINSLLAAWVTGYINTAETVPRQSDTAIWKDTEMWRYMEEGRQGRHKSVRAALDGSEQKPCCIAKPRSKRLRKKRGCSEQSHTSLHVLAIWLQSDRCGLSLLVNDMLWTISGRPTKWTSPKLWWPFLSPPGAALCVSGCHHQPEHCGKAWELHLWGSCNTQFEAGEPGLHWQHQLRLKQVTSYLLALIYPCKMSVTD